MNSSFAARPIELWELSGLTENQVIQTMDALGAQAFAQTDEELDDRQYPFPELINAGMFNAAERAAHLGFLPWARDICHDCGADTLARKKDIDRLIWLLERFPPNPSNPWFDRGADKLWMLCAEQNLTRAFPAVAAAMGPPRELAWARAFPKYEAPADPLALPRLTLAGSLARTQNAFDHAPKWLAAALGARAAHETCGQALAALTKSPGFDPAKFYSPWEEAASARDASAMNALIELGISAHGWAPSSDGLSAWGRLAARPARFLIVKPPQKCIPFLRAAGIAPTTQDLREALNSGLEPLADALEQDGAKPCSTLASWCFETEAGSGPKRHGEGARHPNARLLRWLSQGDLDLVETLQKGAQANFGSRSWAAEILIATSQATASRPEQAKIISQALARSPSWNPSDEKQRALLFAKWDSAGIGGAMSKLAKSQGAVWVPSEEGRVDEGLAAWWEALSLRWSVAPASLPGRKPRAL